MTHPVRLSDIKKSLSAAIRMRVALTGLRPCGAVFVGREGDGVQKWLGFPLAVYTSAHELTVTATVGVRHIATETMVAHLLNVPLDKCGPPTISIDLAHLVHEEPWEWSVYSLSEVEGVANQLASAIDQFAAPYWATRESLPAIIESLRKGEAWRNQVKTNLPVTLFLAGQTDEAVALVMQTASEVGHQGDYGAMMIAFAERFRKLVGAETASRSKRTSRRADARGPTAT